MPEFFALADHLQMSYHSKDESARVRAGRSCNLALAPSSRRDGADPIKLHRQVARHGTSIAGMPPPDVKRGSDGELVIYDGVTRASRAAKYLPATPITVEVTGTLKSPVGDLPTVGDKL